MISILQKWTRHLKKQIQIKNNSLCLFMEKEKVPFLVKTADGKLRIANRKAGVTAGVIVIVLSVFFLFIQAMIPFMRSMMTSFLFLVTLTIGIAIVIGSLLWKKISEKELSSGNYEVLGWIK